MSITKKLLASSKNTHFQSLLGSGVVAIFGLLVISILYRTLKIDIATYVLFLTCFGFVDTLRSGFLSFAFVKFYAGVKVERASEITGSTWFLALLITAGLIVLSVVALAFSSYIGDPGIVFFLKYFPWVFLAGLPYFMAGLVLQGDKRFDRLLLLRFVNQISFTILVVALAVLKKTTVDTVLQAYTISNLAASLAAMFCGWTMISSMKHITKSAITDLFNFGKYSIGTNISTTLFKVTDVFFIETFLGKAALGVYYLGGRLVQIIEVPLSSFVASGMPALSDLYNNGKKEEMMQLMKKLTGMVSVALFGVAILSILFAEPIIMVIGGKDYIHTAAPNLFRIFMFIAAFSPADRLFAVGVDVIHKPQINFYKIWIMLVVNLVGDLIGTLVFHSIYGVVCANMFPILTGMLVAYIPLNNYYPFSLWGVFVTGYKECILLLKQGYQMVFSANDSLNPLH